MGAITGTIKRADTTPVASTAFQIMRISGNPVVDRKTIRTFFANQYGQFIIYLEPGRYRFYWNNTDMLPFTVGANSNYQLSQIVDFSQGY